MLCKCPQIRSHGICCHHLVVASHAEDLLALAAAMVICHQPATSTQPYCMMMPCGCMEEWLTCRRGPTSGGGTLVRWTLTLLVIPVPSYDGLQGIEFTPRAMLTVTLDGREVVGLMPQSFSAKWKYRFAHSVENQGDPRTVLDLHWPASLLFYPYSFPYSLYCHGCPLSFIWLVEQYRDLTSFWLHKTYQAGWYGGKALASFQRYAAKILTKLPAILTDVFCGFSPSLWYYLEKKAIHNLLLPYLLVLVFCNHLSIASFKIL